MKIKYLGWLFIASCAIMATSCDSIEDRDELTNSNTLEGVQLVAVQNSALGNEIELKMVSPGVTGYWDYGLDIATTDRIKFVYPIPGKSTFTYHGTLGAEFFTKTIDVQVNTLDTPLDQDWYDLVSTNTAVGKDWEFAGEPGSSNKFWYMSPGGDITQYETAWWNAGECCAPSNAADGVMHFDLNGAANYKIVDNDTEITKGSFKLDLKKMELSIKGDSWLLGGKDAAGGNNRFLAGGDYSSPYKIVKLTETELILYLPSCEQTGTGWTFIYKAKI